MKQRGSILILIIAALWSGHARSQSCTAVMDNVAFGNISTVSPSPVDVSGNLKISCSGFATPKVRICAGIDTPDGFFNPRYMNGPGGQRLGFNIYSDSSRTQIWGSIYNATYGPVSTDLTLSGGAGTVTIPYYARVDPTSLSTAPFGSYSVTYLTGQTMVQTDGWITTPPACTTNPVNRTFFSFTVTANVIADCNISATNINFGVIGVSTLSSPVTSTGTVTATCTNNTNYVLSMNAGLGSGATVALRKMTRTSGGQTLTYRLYSDSNRTQMWGDGSNSTGTVAVTGNGNVQTRTVYGSIPVQVTPQVGNYSDTITVTVTY